MTLEEFVHTDGLYERDAYRRKVVDNLVNNKNNIVIAVSPISYCGREIKKWLNDKNILCVELVDEVIYVYNRLVFSDKNDCIYKDEEYKEEHKDHYLKSIVDDFVYYGKRYQYMPKFNINGKSAKVASNQFLKEFYQFLQKALITSWWILITKKEKYG